MSGLPSDPSCPGPVNVNPEPEPPPNFHVACTFDGDVDIPADIPVNPEPSPTKLVAVMTPVTDNCFVNKVSPDTVVIPANVETPVTFKLDIPILLDTVRLPPIVIFVLIATLFALRLRLFGLVIVGVPEAFSRFNSFTPKLLSAIILFSYL